MYSELVQDLGQGVFLIDIHYKRPGLAACYLVREGDEVALIDAGTARSVPTVLGLLRDLGLGPEQVRAVIPTHVHLDHAGGVGQLMALFPEAMLVVHPRGAPHLIDPAKLTAGATAVYGAEGFATDFDRLQPVPESRVIEATDGFIYDLDGRPLACFDTPGHARHHLCVWDERTRGIFSGDTLGISYRPFDVEGRPWIFPPATPVQFEPEVWHQTLDRLAGLRPERFFLTHFGMLEGVEGLFAPMHQALDDYVAFALAAGQGEGRDARLREAMWQWYLTGARAHGCRLFDAQIAGLLDVDLELNTQGLGVWLDRPVKAAG